MGYYTRYTLDVEPVESRDMIEAAIAAERCGHNPFDESCKWYQCKDDIAKVSRQHPACIIIVHGEGEESGDIWTIHAQGGDVVKHRAPKWVPPEPSEVMRKRMQRAVLAAQDAEAEAEEARERELYERLRAKYGNAE